MAHEDWQSICLGDVLSPVFRSEEVHNSRTYRLMGVRWYGNGCHLHDEVRGEQLKTKVLNRVAANDVVYNKMWAKKGAFAVATQSEDGLHSTNEYPAFGPDLARVDPNFLRQRMRLRDFIEQASNLCRGTTSRARLNPADFLKLRIALPPLSEQHKIAAILSSMDDTVRRTEAAINQLEVVKKGLLGELLTRGMPSRHREFRATEVGLLPAGWAVSAVGKCCAIENNLRKPINREEREKIAGPYPYYGPTKVLDHINEYRIEGTYALIGEDGDHFLKFASWPMTQLVHGKFNVNNHAHVVRGTAACSAEWLYLFFLHRDIVDRLTRQGAGRYKLKKETLLTLPIALPPSEEQGQIVDVIASFGPALAANRNKLAALCETRAALLDALLSGRVRVNAFAQEAA